MWNAEEGFRQIYKKRGRILPHHSPADAAKHGIAMVVQELGIVGNLPGIVNMFLGRWTNI